MIIVTSIPTRLRYPFPHSVVWPQVTPQLILITHITSRVLSLPARCLNHKRALLIHTPTHISHCDLALNRSANLLPKKPHQRLTNHSPTWRLILHLAIILHHLEQLALLQRNSFRVLRLPDAPLFIVLNSLREVVCGEDIDWWRHRALKLQGVEAASLWGGEKS